MTLTVFLKDELLAQGSREEVVPRMRELQPLERTSDLLAFDDETGRQIDLDLRPEAEIPRPRGRPALGVEAKEITLLPRHWEWLAQQRGGASATLRKLVEEAIRKGLPIPPRDGRQPAAVRRRGARDVRREQGRLRPFQL
jgi:hypothetical protein